MKETSGNAAIFVNPYNINDIRNKIISLNQNKKKISLLIKQGYKNVERFKIRNLQKQYINIYNSLYESLNSNK